MSIKINANLDYLKARLNIPQYRLEQYKDKTIEEILEAEAAAGNQEAIKKAADMFCDVNQLIELFRLADPENKLIILRAMKSSQLEQLIPMLEKDDLVEGLNFFTQSSLLDLLKDIPKEELLKTVFDMFTQRQIIENMPEKDLDGLLTGEFMDKGKLLDSLNFIPDMYLQQIIESVTGEAAEGSTTELINQIGSMGDMAYKQAITNLESDQKRQLTLILTSQDNKLYEKFNTDTYTKIINRERDKDDTVKAMGVIKPEYLQKMMTHLPEDLLSVVITQIDTEKFADALINRFPELLAQFVAAG